MNTQTLQKWDKVKLGDVAEIESGGTPSSTKSEYWDGGEICWATLPDLKNKYLFDTQRKITPLGLKNSSAKLLPINSVIFSSRATIGEVAITKVETSTNQGSKNFICDPKKIDYEFLYYLLKSKVEEINNLASGATYKEINKTVFSGVEVEIPNIPVQKQIAQVLAIYDDLIYNNTRRIQILEQIAQATYTEWFVNFRFPGHEKVRMIDSRTDFGKIPEGWSVGKLSDLANITMGQSPSSNFYNESGEGSPFHQGVTNFDFRFPATTTFSTGGMRRANAGDILFSVRAPVGRINVADRDMIIGRGLSAIKSISGHQSHLLYDLKHIFQTEDLIGGGAIFASVTKNDLNNFPVIIPDIKLIEEFELNVRPIDQLILNISHELLVLKNSRDLILPKLVTGEITIK